MSVKILIFFKIFSFRACLFGNLKISKLRILDNFSK